MSALDHRRQGERGSSLQKVAADVAGLATTPGLATVLVGNDPASAIYVRNKRKRGVEAGMRDTHRYPCAMLSGLGAMLSGFGVVLAGDVAQSVQDAQFGIDGGGDAGDAAGELLGRQWLFGVTKDGRPRAAKGGPR
jgi:methylenetetrahydrofolate dehydrogenase (NADP+)/methenyltetrahydrofolate cyclohydrolase